MNSIYFIQAIYTLYPEVTVIRGVTAYDAEGNEVQYDEAAVNIEAGKLTCKATAQQLLQATDWTSIADVGNPEMSNPYLINQTEFVSYRSIVRNYAVNPVANPVFPTAPIEQWSS
jgi:hypothetical protein